MQILCQKIMDLQADLNNAIQERLDLEINAESILLKYWVDCSGNISISKVSTNLPNGAKAKSQGF